MVDHYYTNRPTTDHDRKEFVFDLRGRAFKFKTDSGVFSRERIDYGSVILIEEMEIHVGDDVLDIGCGYGPVGITAASLSQSGQVLMIDINERAVELAQQNIRINQIHNARAVVSDQFQNVSKDRLFDVILTNPPIRAGKQVVHQILEDSWHYLKDGGSLWVVIQKKQGAPSAVKKLEEVYQKVERVTQDKGYWILKATKKNN
ncbi:MAG TPA: class I SAM-dependent methyltransferase [Bacillota bacterium]|nr:class I SAM-dependent methyltransferase [Bacillota bacterium]